MIKIKSPTIEHLREDQHQFAIKKMNDILDRINEHICEISIDPKKINLLKIRNVVCNPNRIINPEALKHMVITLHQCALIDKYCSSLCADLSAIYHLQELKAIDLKKEKFAFRRELLNTCQIFFETFLLNKYNISEDDQLGNLNFIIELYRRRLISMQVMLTILCCLLWGLDAETNYKPLPLEIQMATILLDNLGKDIKDEIVGQQIYKKWIELTG